MMYPFYTDNIQSPSERERETRRTAAVLSQSAYTIVEEEIPLRSSDMGGTQKYKHKDIKEIAWAYFRKLG